MCIKIGLEVQVTAHIKVNATVPDKTQYIWYR